jgi:hypothetical protein
LPESVEGNYYRSFKGEIAVMEHEKIQDMLAAYESGMLSAEERKEVEEHLQECDSCFQDLYEFAPVAQEIRQQRLQSKVIYVSRHRKTYQYLMAAIFVIAAAVGLWIYRTSTTTEEPVLRSSDAITLTSPAENQEVSFPVLFRWTDKSNADEYAISVYDAKGQRVVNERVKNREYRWNPPGASGIFRWNIEAYLSDGTRTASSKVLEFKLK